MHWNTTSLWLFTFSAFDFFLKCLVILLFSYLWKKDQSGLVFLGLSTETGDCKLCVCVRTQGLTGFIIISLRAGRQASLPLQCQEAECSIVGTLTCGRVICFEVVGRPWMQFCNPQGPKFLSFPLLLARGFAFSGSHSSLPWKMALFPVVLWLQNEHSLSSSSFVLICAN